MRVVGVGSALSLTGIIPNSDKDIPAAPVVFVDGLYASGCYYHPHPGVTRIGGREFECNRGILVADVEKDFDGRGDALAHEWRHHWQYCHGWVSDSRGLQRPNEEYYEFIRRYFRSSRSEMDAELYAWRVTGKPYEPWADALKVAI